MKLTLLNVISDVSRNFISLYLDYEMIKFDQFRVEKYTNLGTFFVQFSAYFNN